MATERTVVEAENYIYESIVHWKSKGLEKRIISLSNWAECWRVLGDSTETASKIKILKSGLRDLQRLIDKNQQVGLNSNGLQEESGKMYESLTELQASYKPTKRTRKSKK
jgi:hypothetical protein